MTRSHSPSAAPQRPLLTVAVGLLLLLAQLAGAAHLAFTEHQVCLEHGDFVHGSRAAPSTQPDRTVTLSTPARDGLMSARGEHDHCSAQTFRRQGWTPPAAPTIVSLFTTERLELPAAPSFQRTGPALYRLAPKHSPPARLIRFFRFS